MNTMKTIVLHYLLANGLQRHGIIRHGYAPGHTLRQRPDQLAPAHTAAHRRGEQHIDGRP